MGMSPRKEDSMARHWTTYTTAALTDRQIRALDAMADAHGLSDGLDAVAKANGLSRSKASRELANRFQAKRLVDETFRKYGRRR